MSEFEPLDREPVLPASSPAPRSSWPGAAFIVEALILLLFFAGALAVFMNLLSEAHVRGQADSDLSHAVVLASNCAEEFAADPLSAAEGDFVYEFDEYVVKRAVSVEPTAAGAMYRAHIEVFCASDDSSAHADSLYCLDTARYVSEVG